MKRTYTTKDLNLAAYQVLMGIEVVGIEFDESKRAWIVLANEYDAAWRVACEFYTSNPLVRLGDLTEARGTLLTRIKAMREEVAA